MKTTIFIFSLLASSFASFAQNNFYGGDGGTVSDCPQGFHPAYVENCDVVNFHRPKTGCTRGFFFCTIGCDAWHWECVANPNFKAEVGTNAKAKIWGEFKENQFVIHFPAALRSMKEYTAEDLAVFSVDTELEFYKTKDRTYKMLIGEYKVETVGEELIVKVNIK